MLWRLDSPHRWKFCGMDGGTSALAIASLAGPLLGGMTAPEGQELQSFEGVRGADPRDALVDLRGLLEDFLGASMDRAAQPVTLNTTVNPLPSFHGGGLPMPIAAPALDANLTHPERRTTPGISIPRRTLRSSEAEAGMSPDQPFSWADVGHQTPPIPRPGFIPDDGTPPWNDTSGHYAPYPGQGYTPQPRGTSAADPLGFSQVPQAGRDDLEQALGAVRLLLRGGQRA